MYSLVSNRGKVGYNIQKFVVDTEIEISELPIDGAPGSIAFVIENGNKYMLTNTKEWKLLPATGGGSSIDPTAIYIYDGGVI